MGEHFVRKCKYCYKVLGSCRCPGPNKVTVWDVCDDCKVRDHLLHPTNEEVDSFIIDKLGDVGMLGGAPGYIDPNIRKVFAEAIAHFIRQAKVGL